MSFLSTSIGKKYVMGAAGLVWTLFVLGHMSGNLLIFAGPEAFNKYGHAIVNNKPLLYGTEVVLVLALLTHVTMGVMLTMQNKSARSNRYASAPTPNKKPRFGSRTMMIQGSLILAFVIYHLVTFKYGPHYEVSYDGVVMRDLYRLVIEVFNQPGYVAWYIVCLVLLGIHLSHGASSVFQSFGLNHPKYTPKIKMAGWVYAIVVAGGFLAQPIYVYLFL